MLNIDDFEKENKEIKKVGYLHWFHWLVIFLSILLTIGAWYFTRQQVADKIENHFNRESERIVDLTTERMQKYEDALWAGVAAIHSQSTGIDYKEWERFADTLQLDTKYPGINGIGVIYYIPPERIDSFLANEQKERPYFKIYPAHDKNEYWPITFIEPLRINAKALGLDMAHEANRYTAALKARDSGTAQITGPITLVQDEKKTPGFLFYSPFYLPNKHDTLEESKKNFAGMVYAPFIMYKLMKGVLEKEKRQVRIKITDQNETIYNELIEGEEDFDFEPLLKKELSYSMYGREWKFDIWSTKTFRTTSFNAQPLIILAGGVTINFLLIFMFTLMARSNRRSLLFSQRIKKGYTEKSAALIETEALAQSIIENSVEGLVIIDSEDKIKDFNPASEKMFGHQKKDVIDRNSKILIVESYHNKYKSFFSKSPDKVTIGSELEGKTKDGSSFSIDVSISKISLKNKKYYSLIFRDITQRKIVEKMKDEFISTVNHELRTPLTSIQGSLALLKSVVENSLDAKSLQLLNISYNNCQRLSCLVNDILDMEKIYAGKVIYKMEIIEMCGLTREIIASHQSYADRFNIQFDVKFEQEEIYCEVDKNRFTQALINLISNAAKFSPKGSIVRVRISTIKDQTFRVSVADEGPGIPLAFRDKIFEKFTQVDSSSTRLVEGSGLGLNITKSIINAFAGTVSFETEEGKGSTFYIELPLCNAKRRIEYVNRP